MTMLETNVMVDPVSDAVTVVTVPAPQTMVFETAQRGPAGADGPAGSDGPIGPAGPAGDLSTVASNAALKAVTSPTGTRVTAGHSSLGDGGAGVYLYDTNSTATDDGGTILKPDSVSGAGRWLRSYSGSLDVRWFGATGDGLTADDVAIQAAIDAAYALRVQSTVGGGILSGRVPTIFFPSGVYRLNAPLVSRAYINYDGDGAVLAPVGAVVTANATTNIITTSTASPFVNDDPVLVYATGVGVLPSPLVAGTTYWVTNASGNTFKLAATLDGLPIDLTTAGTATLTITRAIDLVTAVQQWNTFRHMHFRGGAKAASIATGNLDQAQILIEDCEFIENQTSIALNSNSMSTLLMVRKSRFSVTGPSSAVLRAETGDFTAFDDCWITTGCDETFVLGQPPTDFTVNSTSNVLTTLTTNPFVTGNQVRVHAGDGALPSPLVVNTTYWVIGASGDTLQLAASSGGAAIDLTTDGTGDLTLTQAPNVQARLYLKDMLGVPGSATPSTAVWVRNNNGSLTALNCRFGGENGGHVVVSNYARYSPGTTPIAIRITGCMVYSTSYYLKFLQSRMRLPLRTAPGLRTPSSHSTSTQASLMRTKRRSGVVGGSRLGIVGR